MGADEWITRKSEPQMYADEWIAEMYEPQIYADYWITLIRSIGFRLFRKLGLFRERTFNFRIGRISLTRVILEADNLCKLGY